MKVTLWGTRGSLAAPGPETARYGGNTACVAVEGAQGTRIILDAGTGLRRLGMSLSASPSRVDILLTHLHLDHIQGLGFFPPLYDPETEAHLWGPASILQGLKARLRRYLSPPLFPVHLRDLPRLHFHDLPCGEFALGEFRVQATRVCHPGLTMGYRISDGAATLAYLPDHEPALGVPAFPLSGEWTSGYALARDADLLIHDAQYTPDEYVRHVGWGHSSWQHALAFARLAEARHLLLFHHDPAHTDEHLDRIHAETVSVAPPALTVTPGAEGTVLRLP